MKRPSKRMVALLASGAVALGAGGATIGIAASGGDENHAKALADALNKNEGTKLTETDVREAMESVVKERLDEAVAAGTLTQEQANERLQHFKDAPKRQADREAARAARIAPVEKLLGMSAEDIREQLRDGSSLAKLAESKGKSRADLIAALKEGIAAANKAMGVTLNDERLTEAAERLADRTGNGGRHGGGPGRGYGGYGPGPFGP